MQTILRQCRWAGRPLAVAELAFHLFGNAVFYLGRCFYHGCDFGSVYDRSSHRDHIDDEIVAPYQTHQVHSAPPCSQHYPSYSCLDLCSCFDYYSRYYLCYHYDETIHARRLDGSLSLENVRCFRHYHSSCDDGGSRHHFDVFHYVFRCFDDLYLSCPQNHPVPYLFVSSSCDRPLDHHLDGSVYCGDAYPRASHCDDYVCFPCAYPFASVRDHDRFLRHNRRRNHGGAADASFPSFSDEALNKTTRRKKQKISMTVSKIDPSACCACDDVSSSAICVPCF
mmetsp:Transcript_9585/g.20108  ORF Transcript_9585/g.20108 Transcript_9585/m.20108 type:complete len:281 (-) Transcript_9585:517-1359(-)